MDHTSCMSAPPASSLEACLNSFTSLGFSVSEVTGAVLLIVVPGIVRDNDVGEVEARERKVREKGSMGSEAKSFLESWLE
jgi:hypothetical protein